MTMAAPDNALAPVTDELATVRRALPARVLRFVRRQPLGTIGLVLVVVVTLVGISADWIAPYDPTANDFAAMTQPPSWAHLLGTDQFGRDLLSRIIYGARTAVVVGLSASMIGGFIGLVLGVASAYFGGRIDLLVPRARRVDGFSADHHGARRGGDFRHRGAERDHRDHDSADPALRPGRALECPLDPRGALY